MDWDDLSSRLFWWIAGLLLAAAVAFVLRSVVGGVVFGIFLYYAVRPIYARVVRWLDDSDDDVVEDSTLAATAALLIVGLPIVLVVAVALYRVLLDLSSFLASNRLGQYRSLLQPYLGVVRAINQGNLAQRLQPGEAGPVGAVTAASFRPLLNRLSGYVRSVFGILVDLFVMLLVAYYLLQYDEDLADWARETFAAQPSVVAVFEDVDDDLQQIFWGNLVTVLATAVVAGVVYYALQLLAPRSDAIPYLFLSALVTGIFTLIPVVGIKLFYFPMTGYLFYRAWTVQGTPLWFPIVFFVVTLIFVDTVPDFFIRSWISSGDLNMGLVLISYVFGSIAFGWYGIFLGPILLVVVLHFARTVLPRLARNASLTPWVE